MSQSEYFHLLHRIEALEAEIAELKRQELYRQRRLERQRNNESEKAA